MKKLILFSFLVLFGLSVWGQEVKYITTEEFKAAVFDYTTDSVWNYRGSKPCVIDFYTTWCGPCKRLAPIMEELAEQYCDQVVFYKADTERERELAYVFGISSIPQVLFVPAEGKPILLGGLRPKEELVKIINEFLLKMPKSYSHQPDSHAPGSHQPGSF